MKGSVDFMDLKQLRYFLAIAEEGQITAAAQKLHIAQPPLSYCLRTLEEELGVQLVERGPRRVRLTGAGELLRKRAEQLLQLAGSTEKEVADYGRGLYGVLSIGTISSSGGVVPNGRMREFTANYPNIRFELFEGNTFTVIEMLEKGIVELGIVRTPFPHKMLNCRYAPAEPMVAVMTPDSLCGETAGTVTLRELDGRPLITYRRFDPIIGEAFAKAGIEPYVCCKNDDARTTILWARAGLGIGIAPRSAVLTVGGEGLVCKEILCAELMTSLAVIWAKNRYLSSLGQKFVEYFS